MQGPHSPSFLDDEIPTVVLCSAANRFLARHFHAEENRQKPQTSKQVDVALILDSAAISKINFFGTSNTSPPWVIQNTFQLRNNFGKQF